MRGDWRATLGAVAKMAVLCGGLGLALYAALGLIAQLPGAAPAMGLPLSAPLAVLVAWQVIGALRDGTVPMRGVPLRRDREPAGFWFAIAWFGGCAIALAAIALWCACVLLACIRA